MTTPENLESLVTQRKEDDIRIIKIDGSSIEGDYSGEIPYN